MTNKKKDIIYLIIGIATLIALITGATYAYFQAQTKNGTNASVDITSGTTDHLVFATDGNITINASADNFKENGQDLSETATASAILTANNTNHIANDTYNVYLDITSNNLEYSSYKNETETKIYLKQEEKEEDITNGVLDSYTPIPELYLKVEGPTTFNKKINGLNLDSEGYDITEKRGLITIAEDVPISTTAPEGMTTDTWTITIVFKNLPSNQQLNTGKELKGKIIIQKEKLALSKLLADANKEGQEPTLLYHDGQKDYVKETNYALEAEDYSYRYTGGNDIVNNYVCFGGDCSNNPNEEENYSNLYRIIGLFDDDKDGIYNMKLIKADYATKEELGGQGVGAYYNTYLNSTYTNGSDNKGYYKGDIENYFSKITTYYWNKEQNNSGNNVNDWSESNLNTENLNKTYLNYIQGKDKEKWYNMIEDHTWTTAGNTYGNIVNAQYIKIVYKNEIVDPDKGTAFPDIKEKVNSKIGLMYVSDYGYASKINVWNETMNSGKFDDNNWLFMGLSEWTITRENNVNNALIIYNYGTVGNGGHSVSIGYFAVRPCLYLNSNVKIIDGDGTSANPYIISQ